MLFMSVLFYTRVQAQGESVETLNRSLHKPAEHCSFKTSQRKFEANWSSEF